ncbi:MAG: prolyl oligopeptidase family serine peptidase [Verrucomicrobiales bacterium]|nr:prolyl oligopeptidase family serine peptidase [Verrucomicrobiales bacterium]
MIVNIFRRLSGIQQGTVPHSTGYSLVFCAAFFLIPCSSGQEEIPPIPRRIPPAGMEMPADLRQKIEKSLEPYEERLWEISDQPYSGDVEVLVKAVQLAVRHNEFYSEKHFALAEKYLKLAEERYHEIEENKAHPWSDDTGLVIRGYRSSIDESCQPYGLEISPDLDLSKPVPLVVWLHGRGDKTTDIHFLERCASKHQAFGGLLGKQNEAIILHPFGRQCVGWKHAGEIDVFEAIEAAKRDFPVDPDKIVLAGFSMGGAGAWHIGAHYREHFCAVTPGAGFAETARYNNLQPENFPPKYEQTLWGLYDVPEYRRNFLNGPLLAYSGEVDKQKAAADLMAGELLKDGHTMRHVIGKEMAHKYNKESVAEIWDWIRDTWSKGTETPQKNIYFQTRTLRYPSYKWLKVTGLEKHWDDTRVDGTWDAEKKKITLLTTNVSALEIVSPDKTDDIGNFHITINNQTLKSRSPGFPVHTLTFRKKGDTWQWGERSGIRKKTGIQGPIDDAFMSRFVVVPPRSESIESPKLQRWVEFELEHFRDRWQALLRGKLLEEKPYGLDSGDINGGNLILWGDPFSNKMIAEIVDRLPIEWEKDQFTFRGKTYSTEDHVPAFIFPNPLNPDRYIVINSGLTFREDHDRTNSLQNPKLPDWAVIGLNQLPDGSAPGKIVAAGFFDENWK